MAEKLAGKFPGAKITDLTVEIDAGPVETTLGQVAWATVAITYVSSGVEPTLVIRVPVPWTEPDKEREALRSARQLIDHACTFSGLNVAAPAASPGMLENTVLEGLSQELGISEPQTRPTRARK